MTENKYTFQIGDEDNYNNNINDDRLKKNLPSKMLHPTRFVLN